MHSTGDCLLDSPEKTIPLPAELPGLAFGLDRQCQQAFGEVYTHCPNAPEDQVCAQLWCREEGKMLCTTRNGSLPWADGTPCGEERRCREGSCVSSVLEEAEEVCMEDVCICVIRFYYALPVSTYASKMKRKDWKRPLADLWVSQQLYKSNRHFRCALLMAPYEMPCLSWHCKPLHILSWLSFLSLSVYCICGAKATTSPLSDLSYCLP